jgi:hypothetical protein
VKRCLFADGVSFGFSLMIKKKVMTDRFAAQFISLLNKSKNIFTAVSFTVHLPSQRTIPDLSMETDFSHSSLPPAA